MIEAVVQTGAFETRYRRAGHGGAVLLLVGDERDSGAWLFEQLAARFRTIAPTLPSGLAGAGAADELIEVWLRGLIDGLGVERPGVVAPAVQGPALLRFAVLDPLRIGGMALVYHGAAAPAALEDAVTATLHPLLLIRIPEVEDPGGRAGALVALTEFLAASP